MNVSRAKPAAASTAGKGSSGSSSSASKRNQDKYSVEGFVERRDFRGALTYLEFQRKSRKDRLTPKEDAMLVYWAAYCCYHMGEYNKAIEYYKHIQKNELEGSTNFKDLSLYIACCEFFLGEYEGSWKRASRATANRLQNHLMLHLAHKLNDPEALKLHHSRLRPKKKDQLCLGSVHYLRTHFDEALGQYKQVLSEHKDHIAINVYIALCYYKLDYHDISLEILDAYLKRYPDSAVALNLRACNHFRLYNGKSAEQELRPLLEVFEGSKAGGENLWADVIHHNLVVFRDGQNAAKVWTPLVDVVPEARLNLAIFRLRNGESREALELVRDLEPVLAQEFILKGAVHASIGQLEDSRDDLALAQQCFQLVGTSKAEKDTIPGRQCMASCFFLLNQFDEVITYLSSIQSYFVGDDDFNWNLGLSYAATAQYEQAEDCLLSIKNETYRADPVYLSWLARCYIMNGKAKDAWDIYLRMDSGLETLTLLRLIANDAFKVKAYYYSAKAFDVLERLDPDEENWQGKRAACLGVLSKIAARKQEHPENTLSDIMNMLRESENADRQEAGRILSVIEQWLPSS